MDNQSAASATPEPIQTEDTVTSFSAAETKSPVKLMLIIIGIGVSVILGTSLGYVAAVKSAGKDIGFLSTMKGPSSSSTIPAPSLSPDDVRDSATGMLEIKPDKDKKIQGSHILKRDDAPWPVYLISSVVDLAQYEKKHVKVSGFTYGCGAGIWCLEVNKVEEK